MVQGRLMQLFGDPIMFALEAADDFLVRMTAYPVSYELTEALPQCLQGSVIVLYSGTME
jgi:hypothetical protein